MKKVILGILSIISGMISTAVILCLVTAPRIKSEPYLYGRVVMLTSAQGQCSGEQVRAPSGKDYILTAGHCAGLAVDGKIDVTTEDGKHYKRRVIAEDGRSDLLLLAGVPHLRGLDIAIDAKRHDHIRTFTHGKGHAAYKTEGELMETRMLDVMLEMSQDDSAFAHCDKPKHKKLTVDSMFGPLNLCLLHTEETQSTAMTVPGSSGGMIVNDKGDLVGVVSAGDGNFSAFVRLKDIRNFLRKR